MTTAPGLPGKRRRRKGTTSVEYRGRPETAAVAVELGRPNVRRGRTSESGSLKPNTSQRAINLKIIPNPIVATGSIQLSPLADRRVLAGETGIIVTPQTTISICGVSMNTICFLESAAPKVALLSEKTSKIGSV